MSKYAKLVMVTSDNNNKYYEMTEDGTGSFDVKYGRIESTAQTARYSMSHWESKYREKQKKGYKDVTHTVQVQIPTAVDTPTKLSKIADDKVDRFLSLMKKYTDGLVASTYTVKAQNVTQTQVDNAQGFIDKLTKLKKTDVTGINSILLELYMEIPRFMGNVKDYLLPNIDLTKTLQQEQDNLDSLQSQVSQLKAEKIVKKSKKKDQNLLDLLGITMSEQKTIPSEIKYLTDQVSSTGTKIDCIFKVDKSVQSKVYDDWISKAKNKDFKFLIHGTRNASVLSILTQGLMIRPVGNYQFSGAVYGQGLYFSETVSKSLNYTGSDSDKILFVFEVHVGVPFCYDGWFRGNSFTLDYKNLQERGFDSTFVKAGNGLLNSEIITYTENQNKLRYIIHLKR